MSGETMENFTKHGQEPKFEQVNHLWKGENDVEVYYSKYAGTVDKSSLSFTTNEDRQL